MVMAKHWEVCENPEWSKDFSEVLLNSGRDGSYQFLGQDCSFFSSVGKTDTGKSLFCFRNRHCFLSIGPSQLQVTQPGLLFQ